MPAVAVIGDKDAAKPLSNADNRRGRCDLRMIREPESLPWC